jgi:DeoR/GlpR family transcriptional regulator of sugar metabolism
LKEYINRKQKEVFQAAKFMKIPSVNDRMAQILKLVYDDADRIMTIKEIESRFSVSDFTARTDLKALVDLGFLEVIQVNKKKQHFVRAESFKQMLGRYRI